MKGMRAYFQIPAGAEARLYIYDEEDGLTPTLSQGEGAIYDLSGRKVQDDSSLFTLHSSLKRGVYIVNGKKVLVK